MTLEEKLKRMKEIETMLQEEKVPLNESVKYLEEAYKLKNEVEHELTAIENKLEKLDTPKNKEV